ncbi:hypothetical protein RCL_jg22563.t1 [Rhizophagus clarus]|uniref:Uncharacterized protein n=1 Tax=Rhizophagus clarus TaxID=94130 RepID=A0A8H3MGQ8_9GLOM|nr:hypothetical protein RCL_jg22563.t1 [Rhizophagus clarus]
MVVSLRGCVCRDLIASMVLADCWQTTVYNENIFRKRTVDPSYILILCFDSSYPLYLKFSKWILANGSYP